MVTRDNTRHGRNGPARLLGALGLALVAGALAACGDEADPAPRAIGPGRAAALQQAPTWSLGAEAARLREQAVAGVRRRGEQDEMLKLEAQLPGFGGFFIDSLGEVVAWLKPSPGGPDAATVRVALDAKYQQHPGAYVRAAMAPAARAEVREAAYSLSELVAFQERISHSPARIAGYAGVGASLFLNRIKVGFETPADLPAGMATIVALGIPRDALVPDVWGKSQLSSTWSDTHRPTRGGIRTVIKSPFMPGQYSAGSHGFVVRANDANNYILLTGHQATSLRGVNGVTGDQLYQPQPDFTLAIATVTTNPPWQTGLACSNNPLTGQPYDYCTKADIALATFIGGVSGERKIGTSVFEGRNGDPGSQEINNWYPIEGVKDPTYIQAIRNIVWKSGHMTGTTTGGIDLICANFPVTVVWGAGTGQTRTLELQCHTRVSFADWGAGDSGAPVFARDVAGGPYWALGIQIGGNGSLQNGTCSLGELCAYYFAPWSNIEEVMGAPLSPRTAFP